MRLVLACRRRTTTRRSTRGRSLAGTIRSGRVGWRRFEMLWGWAYRSKPTRQFQSVSSATTPCRCSGAIVWWDGGMSRWVPTGCKAAFGYVAGHAPRSRAFALQLEAEVERLRAFLESDPNLPSVGQTRGPVELRRNAARSTRRISLDCFVAFVAFVLDFLLTPVSLRLGR